jgi:hypothetical protein
MLCDSNRMSLSLNFFAIPGGEPSRDWPREYGFVTM